MTAYIGRFAPSPTGPLHAGSLVAALASWLDARAHGGQWLVRIEDVDTPRCVAGAEHIILAQLAACGLLPDAPPLVQSRRGALYQRALDTLVAEGRAYPCACSRKDIEDALAALGVERPRHAELVYPGTCRHGLQGRRARAWRFLTEKFEEKVPVALTGPTQSATPSIAGPIVTWIDRRLGAQQQNVAAEVGDFVLKRADGLWAYQLAVVVDDAAQGITHVVRGVDLADNTPRQILLQRALQLPPPAYLHTPLVCAANGEKLSKQNGAQAFDTASAAGAFNALAAAAAVLGLPQYTGTVAEALAVWAGAWRHLYNPDSS
ncbi:tRNA glutamyl-Q(34) synthetase GluQRS [Rhodoferax sediminis]|uniref:Glutamyl-Q tRNA(Asp) synthetase n=1 Tax=Rhodoferax sediminis TaxID=2509614 RepID=A0A515D9S7_9BURK|nr:tRNA glutamyl-Q(34) synthetase GluQRS [Rhodoferax sediminis]QDL37161.1 tRNA glutamyl-Q(34) synthetase GluQRS [Rhodoferax sediminis]